MIQKRQTPQALRPAAAPIGSSVARPRSILVVDVGGSKIKLLASGQTEPLKIPSGREMSPPQMVQAVLEATKDWNYEAVSLGIPASVGFAGPRSEPGNLA